ncbi:MAG: hypothetical protein LW834_07995 [Cyanobium sp. 49614_E6]|jgi:hypothetical protein|nr:hypothetical protein [Cyanobium sp. 49614_E6]
MPDFPPDYPLPTIHLNGTDRGTLLRGYQEAYRQLIQFRDAFKAIEFHSRDYYIQGDDAYARACDARREQTIRIGQLMQYLEAHLIEFSE